MKIVAVLFLVASAITDAKANDCGARDPTSANDRAIEQLADVLSVDDAQWLSAARFSNPSAIHVIAGEWLWKRAQAGNLGIDARAVAAWDLIDEYLRQGLSDDAIAVYESLDEPVRQRITHGNLLFGSASSCRTPHWTSLSFALNSNATDAGLAVAYAKRKDIAQADLLLAAAHQPVAANETNDSPVTRRESESAGNCAATLIHGSPQSDWFAWSFVGEEHDTWTGGCSGTMWTRDELRLAAQRLAESDLPPSWRTRVAARPTDESADIQLPASIADASTIRARLAAIRKKIAAVNASDAAWMGPPMDPVPHLLRLTEPHNDPPSERDRALAAVLEKRLSQPSFNPYRTVSPAEAKLSDRKSECAQNVLRCIEIDHVRWELRLSDDYDSRVVLPMLGLWLWRTPLPDGPTRRFYLGLRQHAPFEALNTDAPLISGGELRLLVRSSEIEEDSIVLPATHLRYKTGEPVELRASLADIMKDSDGDGLTDLAEDRLMLDPHNPDTDGDGIPDGEDTLPNLADQPPTPRQEAFAAALAFAFGTRQDDPQRPTPAFEHVLFLHADPADVGGLAKDRRVIILPTSLSFDKLTARPGFAHFSAGSLSLKMLDDNHAEAGFGSGMGGGKLALDRKNGVWRAGPLSAWVI